MSSLEIVHHVFVHGNCVDGLMAGHVYRTWALVRSIPVHFYPISPSDERTWASHLSRILAGPPAHVVFLDVTIPTLSTLTAASHTVLVIDHHPPTVELPPGSVFNADKCATLLTFEHCFPGDPIPPIMAAIDRIDRWDEPTMDDLAVRELLNPIARTGVSISMDRAFESLGSLLMLLKFPTSSAQLLANGHARLVENLASLDSTLVKCGGHEVLITPTEINRWFLPSAWEGHLGYLVDTTDVHTFDTSLASQHIFNTTRATFFINYRQIVWGRKKEYSKFKYHARSRKGTLDLTTSLVLQGHPQAAGGERLNNGDMLPFISAF